MKYDSELERQVANALPRLFASRGIEIEILEKTKEIQTGERQPDFWVELNLDNRTTKMAVEVKSSWRQQSMDQRAGQPDDPTGTPWLLVMPKIGSTIRNRLRDKRINHADLAGTLYLRLPGICVDVDGGRDDVGEIEWRQMKRPINPFSKKASLVLRVMFESPNDRIRVTELATRTGLATGWASGVSDALVERGYATSTTEGVKLVDPVSALRDWSAAYSWKRNERRSFVVPFDYAELTSRLAASFQKHSIEWALTLIGAAQRRIGYVRYEGTTHVYARPGEVGRLSAALSELYAEESGGDGALSVLDPYYGNAAFFGAERVDGAMIVSDIQLFLDLAHFPVRGPEAAETLIRKRLAPQLGLSAVEIKDLVRDLE